MIRDRGKIKWTSMMLPEHVKLLRDWAEEDTYEKLKLVDEQQLEIMNETIGVAMEQRKDVTITHLHQKRYELLIGNIHYCNELDQKLHIVDRFGQSHYIALRQIVDIQLT